MARDQMIELQFVLLPGVQQLRHVEPEPVAAHRGTLDLPLSQKIVAMQFDLHAERYHAYGRRAAGTQALTTLFRRRLQADRLKRVLPTRGSAHPTPGTAFGAPQARGGRGGQPAITSK